MGIKVKDGIKRLGAGTSINTGIIIVSATAWQTYLIHRSERHHK